MGLSVIWYSEKARDEAVAAARKMNEALEKRVAELERIIGAPAEAVRELHAELERLRSLIPTDKRGMRP